MSEEKKSEQCSAGNGGARAALDKLADKVSAKINQLQYYRDNDCQLDHAKIIAEGRLQQANQILHWIAEAAVSHTSGPQPTSEMVSDLVAGLKYVAEFPVNNSQRQHAQQVLGRFASQLTRPHPALGQPLTVEVVDLLNPVAGDAK